MKPETAQTSVRTQLEQALSLLPDLDKRPSRFGDSHSYFAGGREIAHFHGDGRMDLRLTSSEISRLKSEGGLHAQVKTRGPSAQWAAVHLTSVEELPYVLSLVELAIRANA